MRALVQRVSTCCVKVDSMVKSQIGLGLLIYLGVEKEDTNRDLNFLVEKTSGLRIFPDSAGKMNLSVEDAGGSILVVSQFTLCADTAKGKRPSYNSAEIPEQAEAVYMCFIKALREKGLHVEHGQFGAVMDVEYINHGPVTIFIDSRKRI